jgi:hypothetical protein
MVDRSGSWRDRHRSLAGQDAAAPEGDGADWPSEEAAVAPARWTSEWVGVRLVRAMAVVRSAPGRVGPRAFGNAWPAIVQDFEELVDQKRLEQAIEDRNWRTVERMMAAAQSEIAEQKARDEAEEKRKARPLPTSTEAALADDILDWCVRALKDRPAEADCLTLWAWRRSAFAGSKNAAYLGDKSISRILMKRRRTADRLLAERRRKEGAITVDREKAAQAAAEASAWANEKIAKKQAAFDALRPPVFGPKGPKTNKQRERLAKFERKRLRMARELQEFAANVKSQARARFEKAAIAAGAVQEKVKIRRRDVMPDAVLSRTTFEAYRRAAAQAIADALNRAKAPVR